MCTTQRAVTTAPGCLGHGTDSLHKVPSPPCDSPPSCETDLLPAAVSSAYCRIRHKQHRILCAVTGDAAVNICARSLCGRCGGVARGRGRLGCAHCCPTLRPLHLDGVTSPAPPGLLAGSGAWDFSAATIRRALTGLTRGHLPCVNTRSEKAGPCGEPCFDL